MKTHTSSLNKQGVKLIFVALITSAGFSPLVEAQTVVSYESWIASKGLTGPESQSTADPDHDGVLNALEYVLGGEPNPASAGSNSANLLAAPTMVDGDLICTFKRKDVSEGAINLYFQWSTDFNFDFVKSVWIGATSATTSGVSVTVTEDTPNTATDTITIRVPAANASGKKLFGRLQAFPQVMFRDGKVAGYLDYGASGNKEPQTAGFSIYTAAWPILDTYPGQQFQTGLFGTWMFPKRPDGVPFSFTNDIEGGLGWWNGTRFPTQQPKFRMGGVAVNFVGTSDGPAHGRGQGGLLAVAQISPWLVFPIDGLNLKDGTNGEFFGYGYHPLPLTPAKNMTANPSLQTGANCWTLFLNTTNFKGPVAFFTPYFWSRSTLTRPEFNSGTLDKLGSDPSRPFAMETQFIPSATATAANGEQYGRMRVYLPKNAGNDSILMHRVTNYTKQALWDGVKSWFDGTGPAVTGSFLSAASFPMTFDSNSFRSTWSLATQDGASNDERSPFAWDSMTSSYVSADKLSFGFKSDSPLTTTLGSNVILPQYYHRRKTGGEDRWYPVAASEVPASLLNMEFTTPVAPPRETRVTPAEWLIPSATNPGPAAGPFTVRLNDKSLLTYYWFRFADQPAMLDADLTSAEREAMQLKVVKLHQNWTKDLQYLSPPTVGNLASIDSAQLVTPPAGLEIGYVPIPTRQELTPATP